MRKSPSGSPSAQNERRKAYRKQSGQVSNPGHPSPCNRKARRKAKQPKTVGTIGLRPNTGTLLATLAMLAITEGADAERLAPLLEPTDES